ncbi:MAG TPA: MFS transporter [Chiayiivirga sp.]|nr:MFS transporter [Chiayiivirga sp.]HRO88008.1 MFS transporter [Chiayiivirga sp.]HRQ34552.1 MFS transporter [Chiayiivirga sp.]
MQDSTAIERGPQQRALWMSTAAFTACFAVWTIFSIIGIEVQKQLGLSETQFGLLIGMPILTGSLIRLILGIWADQHGGRLVQVLVMLAAAAATWMLTYADSYASFLLAAVGVGIAGGAFSVGVAYVSRWFPASRQGLALGIFGAGNVGAAVTKLLAPMVMVALGWQAVAQYWAIGLAVMAVIFWFTTSDDPEQEQRRREGAKPPSLASMLEPLKNVQVWRFSLYYFFVFGGFVALSLWLPRYLIGVYGMDIRTAGMVAAAYSIPASLFRVYGGVLSDKFGARRVMYWTFGVSIACCFLLAYPPTDYVIHGIEGPIRFTLSTGVTGFIVLVFVLGFFMSLGKAAVYKHIPVYYPKHVGAVGGIVGLVGGLGGFLLPIAFGALNDLVGIWQSCFALLFVVVLASLVWMHVSIRAMERGVAEKELRKLPELPEMQPIHKPEHEGVLGSHLLEDWRPEDPVFWEATGRRIARRNLWLSIPSLLLSFAVWMVWSVVVAKLPAVGFRLTTDQLFWLAALPALSGATLRIFYSFVVPIFGGRFWTTLATWSLMIPALGIGFAVQNPDTPYWILLLLALLCGFGGGNFASSMSNISFFFPKSEKGHALALNAGLGNLGVSAVQFLVPLVITVGVFGALGGEPLMSSDGVADHQPLWLQNAGFIWVPFIALSAIGAWFGMNDLTTAKASFAEQSVIFRRSHNWIMCWLYLGTFGSFIGYSAAFPLLAKIQFPHVPVLKLAFLGPLVGALSRSFTGWISDRWGGARVTFWVFVGMAAGVLGVVYFLHAQSFAGFFAVFLFLFFVSGVGNASTFQMIPVIMRKEIDRLMPGMTPEERTRQADKESAAIIGFSSAIAAYGGFFIPKSYGSSIALTGSADAALWSFFVFYLSCIGLTWWAYTRRGGLLHDIERAPRVK